MAMKEPSPDVVIVGGGLIGCSAAYFLSRRGARVLLLEKGGVGGETSSGAHLVAPRGDRGAAGEKDRVHARVQGSEIFLRGYAGIRPVGRDIAHHGAVMPQEDCRVLPAVPRARHEHPHAAKPLGATAATPKQYGRAFA